MESVVLDSSVVIAFLNPEDRHHKAAQKALAGSSAKFQISTITVTESLVVAARRSTEMADAMFTDLSKCFSPFIDLDAQVAAAAATLRAKTGLSTPDAIISASASQMKAQLWTLDKALAKAHRGARLIA